MIFHVPKKEMQTLTLKIDNINIEQVDAFNFLGLTLDTNLTWKKHVNKIANKCSRYVLPLYIKKLIQFSNSITY